MSDNLEQRVIEILAKRKKIPAALLKALPSPKLYAKVKFATAAQQTAAKAKIAAEWPTI